MTIWTWCAHCYDRHEFYEAGQDGEEVLFLSRTCPKRLILPITRTLRKSLEPQSVVEGE